MGDGLEAETLLGSTGKKKPWCARRLGLATKEWSQRKMTGPQKWSAARLGVGLGNLQCRTRRKVKVTYGIPGM